MSTRGRPGTFPRSGTSLIPDVSDRTAEVAYGLVELSAIADDARAEAAPDAPEQRASQTEQRLEEVQRAFEAEREALEKRCRLAESYAAEVSERLIDLHEALRERGERAIAERAATERDRARAQEQSAKLKAELDQEKKRAGDARKSTEDLAAKLKAAETSLRAAEAKANALAGKVREATDASGNLRADIEKARKEVASSRQQAEQVRNTIGFQLGHALIGAGTWRGAIALPRALAGLLRESRRRKRRRQGRESGEQRDALFPATPSRTPASTLQALSILDEISEASWGAELKLFRIVRERWKEQIDGSNSDFAFLESCWKGNGGAWEYAFTSPGLEHANAQALLEVMAHLRRRSMKVVFWNKEDPMHYDRFLPVARHADVILTTDARKVADYRRDIPAARVEVLPFAAQPRLCNPAEGTRAEQESLCFAGSYYTVGHEERKRQMDALLPAICEFGGAIYDRMSGIVGDRYRYPSQYQRFIRPAVPFGEMVKLYKAFKVFLNVNTISNSPTMMSRRVYELLACGTPVVSAPSEALERNFSGIVQLATTKAQSIDAVGKLLGDACFRSRISHLGYREVMRKHTYQKRLDVLLPAVGIPHSSATPLVSIVLCTMRPHMIDRLVENLVRQNHERTEVIIIAQGFSSQQKEKIANALAPRRSHIERVEIVTDDSARTLGERFNHGVALSRGDYIAKMDDDDLYFENYLSDMLLPFSFGNYGVVGKKEIFMYLEGSKKLIRRFPGMQHRMTNFVTGATFVVRRDIAEAVPFGNENKGEDSAFINSVRAAGHAIYSADPYNFVVWRHGMGEQHTWKAADAEFLNSPQTTIEANHLDVSRVCI